MSSSKLDE